MQEYRSRGLFTSRTKFSGGSDVLWHPTPTPDLPTPHSMDWKRSGRTYGWVAQRQRPTRKDPISFGITAQLRARDPFEVFWDSRWLCQFSENAIDVICSTNFLPRSVMTSLGTRFVIAPRDPWWTPGIHYHDGSNPWKPHLHPMTIRDRGTPTVKQTFVRTIDAI